MHYEIQNISDLYFKMKLTNGKGTKISFCISNLLKSFLLMMDKRV